MNTVDMADTLSRYGVTLTRDHVAPGRHSKCWSGWNIDHNVLVLISLIGRRWYVGTYMTDVPYGEHRKIRDKIPNRDLDEAVDLALRTLAAINIDVRYETFRRGFKTGMNTSELGWFYAGILKEATRAQ